MAAALLFAVVVRAMVTAEEPPVRVRVLALATLALVTVEAMLLLVMVMVKLPSVWLNPLRSSVVAAVPTRATGLAVGMALFTPIRSVPLVIVVAPV